MHNQDLGRVAVVARGTYDPAAEYERLDAVSYNGSSYLVRKHCQGVEPAEGEHYMLMAKAGDSTAANAATVEALAAAKRADASSGRADTAAGNADRQASAAGAAADRANTAAGNANTAAAGASSAKDAAETAASGANAAAASANQNAAAAETAANAANASAGRADQAAAEANAARGEAAAAAESANAAAAAAQNVVDTIEPDMIQVKQTLTAHGDALDNRIKKFYTGNMGAVSVADSDDGAVRNLVIGGNCVQGDNPSPDNPQEIKCVQNCTITMSNADGTETQTAEIPFTLRGIGDVRDELYVYADGTGKMVQRTIRLSLNVSEMNNSENYPGWRVPRDIVDFKFLYGEIEDITKLKRIASTGWETHINSKGNNTLYVLGTGLKQSEITQNFPGLIVDFVLEVINPIETIITVEQVQELFNLRTYYGGTNVSYESENGVEPVVNFDYACALENFVEYIKAAQGDDRKIIYNMGERMTDAEYVAALAYVNSEYATALTELEV